MRALSIVAIIGILTAALPAAAGDRRHAVTPPDDSLSIVFVDAGSAESPMTGAGGDAWLDLKSISAHGKPVERTTRIRRRVGVRVTRAGGTQWGEAVVTVRLESWDGRATYRLDGRPLTAVPVVIDRHAAVGTVTFHTLDIEVPYSMAEGPLAASIAWEITTE